MDLHWRPSCLELSREPRRQECTNPRTPQQCTFLTFCALVSRRIRNDAIQHLCLPLKGRAFCISRRKNRFVVDRFAVKRGETRRSPRKFSMRNTTHKLIASTIALAALVPSMASAQARPANSARSPGSGQPWQCNPSDSVRAFNRALRADSLARQRAAAGGAAGGARVTGGTGRSQEYPEYDVVLDIPNLCVNKVFLK